MTPPLVVIDADVLGRQRTGDESYVENLLRELPALATDLRLAAVVRDPALVPPGIEPIALPATSQVARMLVRLPRLLRGLRPALAHFLHVVPPLYRGRSVLTIQDLSFEADRRLMGARDRLMFRTLVRPSARRAAAVLTGSEHTRADLASHYGIPSGKVVLTPYGVDPAFHPGGASPNGSPYARLRRGAARAQGPARRRRGARARPGRPAAGDDRARQGPRCAASRSEPSSSA